MRDCPPEMMNQCLHLHPELESSIPFFSSNGAGTGEIEIGQISTAKIFDDPVTLGSKVRSPGMSRIFRS